MSLIRKSFIGLILLLGYSSFAQKFSAERGEISFFSDGIVEDIEAKNGQVGSLLDAGNGEVVFIAKIRDFVFPKSLMREHFNEKYMETEKFPKATFQGKLVGFKPGLTGEQKVRAVGKLNMHGVTRDIDVPGTVEFAGNKVVARTKFKVRLEDYSIKIPTVVWQNIAEEVEVRVDFTYKPI
jgi:hypothetical protein